MQRIETTLGGHRTELAIDDRGQGPALLFLHGLACGRRAWHRQAVRFARTHRTIAFDFPAHGASSAPEAASACDEGTFVEAAIAVLDALGVDRAIAVGHSLGGGIALELAIRHPSRVAALVAVDAGSGSDDPAAYRPRAAALADLLDAQGLDAYADALLASPTMRGYAERSPRARRHMRALILQNDAAGLARVIRGVNVRRPPMLDRRLEAITCPTLVVNGARDTPCLASGRGAATRIARARYLEIPDSGHMLPLEAPAAFDAALAEFLAGVG